MQSRAWMNWAAIGTWLVGALPVLINIGTGRATGIPAWIFTAAFALFGLAMCACLWRGLLGPAFRPGIGALLLQAACGLAMVATSRNGTPGATLVLVAAQLPYFVPPRTGGVWVLVQTGLLAAIFALIAGPLSALTAAVAYGGFQLFALATSSLAISESKAREALSRANAELMATRELLAENTRVSERLRISRDLHDTLGHHLTALSLRLDVASRLSPEPAAAHVREAHAITRLLLGDVRDAVSQLRGGGVIDLIGPLKTLAASAGDLTVHLDVPASLTVEDPAQAHALLRSVQEIITNTARHARARNLWIRIDLADAGVTLHARDDGQGAGTIAWGNGLLGMRERFEELQGRLDVTSTAGRGFEVRAFMPRTASSS